MELAELAGYLFPEASGRLLEVKARERGELLERASRALEHMDPRAPFIPAPAWSLSRAVGNLVLSQLYGLDASERARLAPLLRRVLVEAAALRERQAAEVEAGSAELSRDELEAETWRGVEARAAAWRRTAEGAA